MSDSIHLKYLAKNRQDQVWGLAVNSVGRQQIAPGEAYPPAYHPSRYLFSEERGRVLDEYQLLYITQGHGRFRSTSLDRWIPLHTGSMFLLFPGEWHSYRPLPETGWTEYWIGFEGPIMDSRVRNGFFTIDRPILQLGLHESIINQYEAAIRAALEQRSGFQPLLGSIVENLLGLGYFYCRQKNFSEVEALVSRAKILISEGFRSIGPEEVAQKLHVGYSSFRRIFKEYTGFSPARYILDVKISKVKESLTNSTLPVKQIAYNFGFENYDYFFTVFRRLTGMTPREYRSFTQGK